MLLAVAGISQAASILDLFPDTGVTASTRQADCSFVYEPCGSNWADGVDESAVFLAAILGDGWQLGIGKGGQIYSLRGSFGESIPPQRVESPWNDEVWQVVLTNEELVGPIHKYHGENPGTWSEIKPLLYFIHQSGIYIKGGEGSHDGGTVAAPFYSPCLRKRWIADTKTLEMVHWLQQANTPCVWKSGVLAYTAYRDCGDGVIEVNQILHNFGTETLGFLNTPWGGVRKSSLPNTVLAKPNGEQESVDGVYGWTDIPTRSLVDTGGWMAWAQDVEKKNSPALALVFGTDREDNSHGKRQDEVIRWGTAGEVYRDYEVCERISHIRLKPGNSVSVRWYLVVGKFSKVWKTASTLSGKSGVSYIDFDDAAKQPVWITDGNITTEGKGAPWIELCAFPVKGTVPIFLLEDKRTGEQLITTDPYALAETVPFPNPLPEELDIHEIYNNRVVYKQYGSHIGYKNLLGYAFAEKPADRVAEPLVLPGGGKISLDQTVCSLWIVRDTQLDPDHFGTEIRQSN